jgi:hypothetical protein
MGRPSYTPPINILIPKPSTEIPYCSRGCGTAVELTPDAIGRLRERCPKCDGIARPPVLRPGEVRRTQEIELGAPSGRRSIALSPGVYRLPDIDPGQLRCQVCARGVTGNRRICEPCVADRRTAAAAARPKAEKPPKLCKECSTNPIRRRDGKYGRPPQRCDACQDRRNGLAKAPCACGRDKPRRRVKCDTCLAARVGPRACKRCRGTEQLRPKKQLCDKCHPATKPGTSAHPNFRAKDCARCTASFIPTGPRQLYCRRQDCVAA